jgi:hypothetical protein
MYQSLDEFMADFEPGLVCLDVLKDGLFRRVIGPTGFDKMAADQKAEDLFLSQLARFDGSGCSVSDSPGANYAPKRLHTRHCSPSLRQSIPSRSAIRQTCLSGPVKPGIAIGVYP